MPSPNVTTPELYFKLNRAMTLHADLKGLLDAWVASGAVNLHISECILALVKAHDDTMIRATRGSLDPDLHASPTWDKLGRAIARAHGIWRDNTRPPTFPTEASNTPPPGNAQTTNSTLHAPRSYTRADTRTDTPTSPTHDPITRTDSPPVSTTATT